MEIKLLAGITNDNELYFLEIETQHEGHDYFSMSGFTASPITEEDGKQKAREMLENGECWKQAVECDRTTSSLKDWVQDVLDIDGWQNVLDLSLYPAEFGYNGRDYVFESGSCGQHQEKKLKCYLIDKKDFDILMDLWDKYHFKKCGVKLPNFLRKNETIKEFDEEKKLKKAFNYLDMSNLL